MYMDDAKYVSARQLQKELNYKEWRSFQRVIAKAQVACLAEEVSIIEHFIKTESFVAIGNKAQRKVEDFMLSPHACEFIKRSCMKHNN